MSDVDFSRAQLVEALLQVPALHDRAVRDAHLAELHRALGRELTATRSEDPREDLASLLGQATAAEFRVFAEIIVRRHPGDEVAQVAALVGVPRPVQRGSYSRADERILGDIPIRNRNFTGRKELLDQLGSALSEGTTTSVLPPTLKGLGGVGKTQLVIEYVHRHIDSYDLIWWIPAEQTATVLASLTQLAQRLSLPVADDQQETARTVLNWLASSDRDWLLVYDNADDPSTLRNLLPSTGGHVIVTTRIEEWSTIGVAIEVDVFYRWESVKLLTNRTRDAGGNPAITPGEADELADKLGDLPLALEQAAAWFLTTAMPIREYIDLLDRRVKELLDEGKPAGYPLTVAAFVNVAVDKLRADNPATAQLFSLFAYLGGEPVRQSLLSRGSNADISQPLRDALADSIRTGKIVRDLRRYGLAKTVGRPTAAASGDRTPLLQVHRLVQRVLRDTLAEDEQRQTLRDVQNLLSVANPGDPDGYGEFERQREMGPHLDRAEMIHSGTAKGRQTVLDHARFLYLVGDYENSRILAERAWRAWSDDESSDELGPDGQSTLLARAQIANATRALGDSESAAGILQETYDRFVANKRLLGPKHPYTLITGNQLGHDMRIRGKYTEALRFDKNSLELHREVFGEDEGYTLRVMGNLAVDYRLIGDFTKALELDQQIVGHLSETGVDVSLLRARINVTRDFYGLGAYRKAYDLLVEWMPRQERELGAEHGLVLVSERTHAITLRKMGDLDRSIGLLRVNVERTRRRFRSTPSHEFSLAASMSLANALRQAGGATQLQEAMTLIEESRRHYQADFGPAHPLTLAAAANEAIARRAIGDRAAALAIDRRAYQQLGVVLGPEHPYTICAGASLATDHALSGEHHEARELSTVMLERSRRADAAGAAARGGTEHPYVLMRAINLAHDLRASDREAEGAELFEQSVTALRAILPAGHPELIAAENGERLEGDIEPPPT